MSKAIKLNAVQFQAEEESGLSPVLILHGLFGSARNWQSFAKKLAKERTVYALDMRNHGNSPHSSTMGYPEMAADVVQFLDELHVPSAHLIGHSMGGKAAMTIALNSPERVQNLLIVDIAPIKYDHSYDVLLGNLRGLDLNKITRRAEANKLLGEVLDDDELRLFLLQNLVVRPGEATHWRINLEAIRENIDHLVQYVPDNTQTFSGPVDLIRGAESAYVRESFYPLFKTLFPAINFHVIEKAGHWPHAQNPNSFLKVVHQILANR